MRLLMAMAGYITLSVMTIGYWIEMAEEMQPDGPMAKAVRSLLVLLKTWLLSR